MSSKVHSSFIGNARDFERSFENMFYLYRSCNSRLSHCLYLLCYLSVVIKFFDKYSNSLQFMGRW